MRFIWSGWFAIIAFGVTFNFSLGELGNILETLNRTLLLSVISGALAFAAGMYIFRPKVKQDEPELR